MSSTTARLPLPRVSCGRFIGGDDGGAIDAFTDEALFDACGVRIAFTQRGGGFSSGAWKSLNLGSHVDDDAATVERNRRHLLESLGGTLQMTVVPHQVHGTDIVEIAASDGLSIETARRKAQAGADAIVVDAGADRAAALLCYADCMPVILVAPDGTFGVVHAGWRGVDAHIACKVLERICLRAAADPSECNVYIGPYIHAECFEVGRDVYSRFVDRFGTACALGSDHIDLGTAMRLDLVQAGVDEHRIADVGFCTVCNSERFFSYRAQGGVCGRHGAVALRLGATRNR